MPLTPRVQTKAELQIPALDFYNETQDEGITNQEVGQYFSDIVETMFNLASASTVIRAETGPPPSGSNIPVDHEPTDIWIDGSNGSNPTFFGTDTGVMTTFYAA